MLRTSLVAGQDRLVVFELEAEFVLGLFRGQGGRIQANRYLAENLSTALSDTHPAFRKRLGECFDEMALEFQIHLDEAAASHGLAGDQDTGEMAQYIVSVIEGAIMLTRTHRDVGVIERQVHHLKEDVKRSFQNREAISP